MKSVLGVEFKYLYTRSDAENNSQNKGMEGTEWIVVGSGRVASSQQEKGDSLLPVNFTSCPLINAIKWENKGWGWRGTEQKIRNNTTHNNINNLVDFYTFCITINRIKWVLWSGMSRDKI